MHGLPLPKPPQAEESEADRLSREIGEKAENLFSKKKHFCAPAVMVVLNETLGGGLDPRLIHRLTASLCVGLQGAGCICGALGGAEMALGLFLAPDDRSAPKDKDLGEAARALHDRFKAQAGSTCCRVLTKKVKDDPKAHAAQCARLSGQAAALAAELILERRPELMNGGSSAAPRRGILRRLGQR